MKVFLGGTVNGSTWRNYIIPKLSIAYFNPVIPEWNEQAYERELYERRHCDFCLYVITPKMTGFYALAEVVDDSFKRPDRTIYCYLTEDGGATFNTKDASMLEAIKHTVEDNGGYICDNLDEVIELLNNEKPKGQFLDGHFDNINHDIYISYGRHDSKLLTTNLAQQLKHQGYSVWYDDAPIPQEIEFLSEINGIIHKAQFFIFVVSDHSLKSEYCRRELEYVQSLGKHIIFVQQKHCPLPDSKIEQLMPHRRFRVDNDFDLEPLYSHLSKHISSITEHTRWLSRATHWSGHKEDPDLLLYGYDRINAKQWLKNQDYCPLPALFTITETLRNFIELSYQQPFAKRCMYHFNQWSAPVIYHAKFDQIIGSTAIANPLALLPQLWVLFMAASSEAISVSMWFIFLMLQTSSSLFAIKHRNFGVCMSQFASMVITITIITIALLKR